MINTIHDDLKKQLQDLKEELRGELKFEILREVAGHSLCTYFSLLIYSSQSPVLEYALQKNPGVIAEIINAMARSALDADNILNVAHDLFHKRSGLKEESTPAAKVEPVVASNVVEMSSTKVH